MSEAVKSRFDDLLPHEQYYPVDEKLKVRFLGLEFENPFILAASPCTDEVSMIERALEMGWAGAILKTTSVESAVVCLAYPMMSSIEHEGRKVAGLGNIDLISRYHIDEVEKRVDVLKRKFPSKVIIASIMGTEKQQWQELVRRLKGAGVDMVECSFSCPQGSMGEEPGKMLAQSATAVKKVTRWVKDAAGDLPVSIKITPQVTDITEIAVAVRDGGADAITASNSVPALMGIDIETFSPIPSVRGRSTYSGLTGPAIKPIALRTIAEIAKNVKIPILATGGASNWNDAVEFMAVGAGIVQFCTACMHYGFRIIDDLKSGMFHYIRKMGFSSPAEIVGKALKNIVTHDELERLKVRSKIDESLCSGCGVCYVACRDGGHEAIVYEIERRFVVDQQRCVGCGLCKTVCPIEGCITLHEVE